MVRFIVLLFGLCIAIKVVPIIAAVGFPLFMLVMALPNFQHGKHSLAWQWLGIMASTMIWELLIYTDVINNDKIIMLWGIANIVPTILLAAEPCTPFLKSMFNGLIAINNEYAAKETYRDFNNEAKREILRLQGGKCNNPYCSKSLAYEVINWDHIVPKSRGGTYDPDNMQALCQPCNNRKSDKDWDVFLDEEKWAGKSIIIEGELA